MTPEWIKLQISKLFLTKALYMVSNTPYISEDIFNHKHVEDNGDVVDMHFRRVPITKENPEGVSYRVVYIRKGKRLVGYDNESHGKSESNHHKHIKDRVMPYAFVDEWQLYSDFSEDIDKIKRGVIQ